MDYSSAIITKDIVSILSLFGTSFVILTYAFIEELRTPTFKIVVNMQIADFIYALASLINRQAGKYSEPHAMCIPQAFILNYSQESSVVWTALFAVNMYSTIVQNQPHQRTLMQFASAIVFPIILSIYPLIIGIYAPDEVTCWISESDYIYRIINFFGLLWITVIVTIWFYYSTWKFIRGVFEQQEDLSVHKIFLYPFVLILCWTLPTIEQILLLSGMPRNEWLLVFSIGTQGISGFLNSLIYGMSPQVRQILFKKTARVQAEKTENEIEIQKKSERNQSVVETRETKRSQIFESSSGGAGSIELYFHPDTGGLDES